MADKRLAKIMETLSELYPDSACSLSFENPHELLISARLAAQCTDARVNRVTPALFERFPSIKAFAEADTAEIEEYIRSCGLYKTKARDIKAMCMSMMENFGGALPDSFEGLLTLPGIGRKTANLVAGEVLGVPAVVTDTHCIRLSNRLGLVSSKDPRKVEDALRAMLPPERSLIFCHQLVLHGRAVCTARSPKCAACALRTACPGKQ